MTMGLGGARGWAWLGLAAIAAAVGALATAAYPVCLDALTTELFGAPLSGTEGASVVGSPLGLLPLVVLLKTASQAIRVEASGRWVHGVSKDLRDRLYGRLIRQGRPFFRTFPSAELHVRWASDLDRVEAGLDAAPRSVADGLTAVALVGVCIAVYPRLSLAAVAVLPGVVFLIWVFARRARTQAARLQGARSAATRRLTEALAGRAVIQTSGAEDREAERFAVVNRVQWSQALAWVRVKALQTPAMELLGVVGLVAAMAYARGQVDAGAVRPGQVVGFMLAVVLLYEPIKSLSRATAMLASGWSSAERIREWLQAPLQPPDGSEPFDEPLRRVELQKVGVRLDDGRWALRGLDLSLEPGRVVALVGRSGAGKSTAAELVPRLADPTEGRILANGRDLRTLSLVSWRRQVAWLGQEPFVFDDDLDANVAYGRPDASRAQVDRALERASAAELRRTHGEGPLGERGSALSVGERQRVAIARAFLQDAPILVLDEPISAQDRDGADGIRLAMIRLMRTRAVLLVTHRLEWVRDADEIVVLEDGQVRERGCHDGLVARGGLYARWVGAAPGARQWA